MEPDATPLPFEEEAAGIEEKAVWDTISGFSFLEAVASDVDDESVGVGAEEAVLGPNELTRS